MNALQPVETTEPLVLGQGDWLRLEYITYTDNQNQKRRWERCVRRKPSTLQSSVDAVDIMTVLDTPAGPQVLLVVQYRPAIEKYCIEFPSGLIDPGEDPVGAAVRELKEETGYEVDRSAVELEYLPISYDPGLSNSCCYTAHVRLSIPSDMPPPTPNLEPEEWSLQTLIVPLQDLFSRLQGILSTHDGQLVIDSRVYAYAQGIRTASLFGMNHSTGSSNSKSAKH